MVCGGFMRLHTIKQRDNSRASRRVLTRPFLLIEPEQHEGFDRRAHHLREVEDRRLRHRERDAVENGNEGAEHIPRGQNPSDVKRDY